MITDHATTLNGLKIYYRTAGDSHHQHLVFFDGWGARLSGWFANSNRVIHELAKYFYVVCPELPGFMRSEPPKEIWGFDDYARFAHELVKPLNLKNSFVMGQSFGDGIAATYASLFPHEVSRLILVDAVLNQRIENWYYKLRFAAPFVVRLARTLLPFPLEKFCWHLYLGIPQEMLTKKNVNQYTIMPHFQASSQYHVDVEYSKLPFPILLVWGTRDVWVTPIKRAKELHHEVKNSALTIVKGPHGVLYRKAKETVKAIIKSIS